MKHILLLAFSVSCFSFISKAQEVELSVLTGYQWSSKTETYNGELDLTDNMNFMANLQVGSSNGGFQLMYVYQRSAMYFRKYGEVENPKLSDLNTHYIMIGGTGTLNPDAEVMLFGGLMGGLAVYSPKESSYNTLTRMAFGADVGLKVMITDYIGLKGQATLLLPVQFAGGAVMVGPSGANYGATSGSLFVQLGLDAGITYTFGGE